jgi:hypothetical protein
MERILKMKYGSKAVRLLNQSAGHELIEMDFHGSLLFISQGEGFKGKRIEIDMDYFIEFMEKLSEGYHEACDMIDSEVDNGTDNGTTASECEEDGSERDT